MVNTDKLQKEIINLANDSYDKGGIDVLETLEEAVSKMPIKSFPHNLVIDLIKQAKKTFLETRNKK